MTYFQLSFIKLLVFLFMTGAQLSCADSSNNTTGKPPMMTLTLSTNQTKYVRGEDVRVTATVINGGTSNFEIPDFPNGNDAAFYFELIHPTQQKTTFTFFEPVQPNASFTMTKTHSIQPGGRHWGSANISKASGVTTKGKYSLSAVLMVVKTDYQRPFAF